MHEGCMITIGRIPQKLQRFFRPVKKQVSGHVYDYFWSFVLAICIGHGSTIDKLVKLLRNSTHRTNHGEFLWRSNWGESAVMQHIALDLLCSLFHKKDRDLCAYACLTHLGVQAQRAQGHTKKNRVLRLEPISKLKASLRQMVWQDNIKDVVKYSHEKSVIRRLEKLLAA